MHSEIKKNPGDTLLAIVGPTAGGKSDLAITLARKYDGEIISADSRQVYRGMDIGTGKVTRDPVSSHPEQSRGLPAGRQGSLLHTTDSSIRRLTRNDKHFFSEGIRHHLIDIADPDEEYNISHFLRDARASINDIRSRGKLPIICGGTHFWIQALLDDIGIPAVPPDPALRQQLAARTPEELFLMLEAQDPKRAGSIDRYNTVRLIRALEICAALGTVPPLCHPGLDPGSRKDTLDSRLRGNNNTVIIALSPPRAILRERIEKRLESRIADGMIEEVDRLRKSGQSWERLEAFGLEYRYIALLLQAKITEAEMREELSHAIWHYAKRQLSWLRRWERNGTCIRWISDPGEASILLTKSYII